MLAFSLFVGLHDFLKATVSVAESGAVSYGGGENTVWPRQCPGSSHEVLDGPHRRTSDLATNTRSCRRNKGSRVKFSLWQIWNRDADALCPSITAYCTFAMC